MTTSSRLEPLRHEISRAFSVMLGLALGGFLVLGVVIASPLSAGTKALAGLISLAASWAGIGAAVMCYAIAKRVLSIQRADIQDRDAKDTEGTLEV